MIMKGMITTSPRALRVPVRATVVSVVVPLPVGIGTTALAETLICMNGMVADMA